MAEFWLAWLNLFLPVNSSRYFSSTATLYTNFFKSAFYHIFLPMARVCSGPLCGDLPSLGGTVQRKRPQSFDVDAYTLVLEGFFATERLLWHSSPYRSRLGSRLSGIQTTWPAHFACAFYKRLCAQDAAPLQDLRVQDFIQPPYVEESTEIAQGKVVKLFSVSFELMKVHLTSLVQRFNVTAFPKCTRSGR